MGAPLAQPGVLGLAELASAKIDLLASDPPAMRLDEHLQAGHDREARALVLGLYMSGQSVAAIADGPIRDAMCRLGELWRHDDAGIFIEHRATEICIQAVQQIRLLLDPPAAGFVAVGGAPGRDPYLLPTLLAATALAAEGMQAVNLGPNTPIATLVEAARQHQPPLFWLSVSFAENSDELENDVTELVRNLTELGARLVGGGQALPKLHVVRGANIHVGQSMAELVAFAKGLRAANKTMDGPSTSTKQVES